MSFMDELKKLTQPYGDEDDFYDGADDAFAAPKEEPASETVNARQQFESSFADESGFEQEPAPKKKSRKPVFQNAPAQQKPQAQAPRIRQRRGVTRNESQVMLFNPKNFDEAGELAGYLLQGRSLVMALEGIPAETARRLLDFISGIAFALNAKITPVSAKTYFVTPENVDLLEGGDSSNQEDDDY